MGFAAVVVNIVGVVVGLLVGCCEMTILPSVLGRLGEQPQNQLRMPYLA